MGIVHLKENQTKKQQINIKLIKKCIKYLIENNLPVNLSQVSRVSYILADINKNEKGLTTAALSKNKLYKNLIEQAALKQKKTLEELTAVEYEIPKADLRVQLHNQKIENEKLKLELKILKDQLSKVEILKLNSIPQDKTIEECRELKQNYLKVKSALVGILDKLFQEKIAEVKDNKVVLAYFNDELLDFPFYEKLKEE